MPLLDIRNLSVEFPTPNGVVRAVDDLSFSIERGETLGVVGESGSGKSVTALAILRLLDASGRVTGGSIALAGEPLLEKPESEMLNIRGKRIAMIFQEPATSLNPILSVGDQLLEAVDSERYDAWRAGILPGLWRWLRGRLAAARQAGSGARAAAARLLRDVRIPDPEGMLERHPHTLSGGMMQRVMIATAIAGTPDLVIADEPTTALDVTIQAQVLDILRERRDEVGLTVMLITHDLGLVAELCDHVIVLYAGQMMEQAPVELLFDDPLHPYTRGLLASIPSLERPEERLNAIDGSVPDVGKLPRTACHFASNDRCPLQTELCRTERPRITDQAGGRRVACHIYSHADMAHLRERLQETWPPAAFESAAS